MKKDRKNQRSTFFQLITFALLTGIFLSSGVVLGQDDAPIPPTEEPEDDISQVDSSAVTVPTPLSPSGTIYVQKPTYQWSAVSGAAMYHFQVYKGTTMVLNKKVTTTSSTPGTTLAYADHKWHVRAYVNGTWNAWSAYKTFTVVNPVPTPKSPKGTIFNRKPTYSWSAVKGATKYQFQVYKGTTQLINKTVTTTSNTPNVTLVYASHKWQVRAYAGGKWQVWSVSRSFKVKPATTRVSLDSSGVQGNGDSSVAAISGDKRFVVFESLASNLVSGDTNGKWDIFVHNLNTGTTERVSLNSSEAETDGHSYDPSISADGCYVAFVSDATNLVAGDTNGWEDIFVRDQQSGETRRVSVNSGGVQGNYSSYHPSISADGRYVAFYSFADNLVEGDTNGTWDIFVHDRTTGVTKRVSVDSGGVEANGSSYFPAISADGRFVAFESAATNLVAGDTNSYRDIFVHKQ